MAGLGVGYLGDAIGAVALAIGTTALLARPGRARAWGLACGAIGVRLVFAVSAEQADARAWSALAAAGETRPIQATIEVDAVRDGRDDRWSARGTLSRCPRPCDGGSVAWSGRGRARPEPGERWRVSGRLVPDRPRVVPGSRFPPAGLGPGSRRGFLEDVRLLAPAGERAPLLSTAEEHLRSRIAARFDAPLDGLVVALLLGDRRGLEGELVDAFAATGTLHLLAVSGLHVGFLAGLLAFGLGGLRDRPRLRAGAIVLPLVGYAALVGARPSVVRATTMVALVLWARAGERRVSTWQVLGAAAVGLLAWRPRDLFGLGWVLSFGSVAGLLAFGGPVGRWIAGLPSDSVVARPARLLASGLAATTAATAGTLGVQAAAFGWTAPVGFALNPVAVPLAGLGVPLAWLAMLADATGVEAAAGPLSAATEWLLGGLAALALAISSRSGVWVPGPSGWAAVAVSGLVAAALLLRRRPAAAGMVAGVALAVAIAARPPEPPGWRVVWLDVGQGDAIVVSFPDGTAWLVDAGPADPYGDAGRRVVVPYLRRAGIRELDRLVITHPDLDHVGGARSVVRGVRVARLSSTGPVSDARAWLSLLAARGASGEPVVDVLRAGERLAAGGVSIDVLHPGPEWVPRDPYASRIPENEGSIVLLMSWRRCRLLLTGDLGRPGEAHLVEELGDSLEAGLLHVGHHGSRHSSTAGFLARVRPLDAVVSAGSRNRFGHPHPDALGRLAAVGARVHRTDRRGTVTARCGRDGWRVDPGDP